MSGTLSNAVTSVQYRHSALFGDFLDGARLRMAKDHAVGVAANHLNRVSQCLTLKSTTVYLCDNFSIEVADHLVYLLVR